MMRTKLLFLNLSFILFLVGVALAVDSQLQLAAISMLSGGAIIAGVVIIQIYQLLKASQQWKWHALALCGFLFVLAIIFIHGFSSSIGMMFVYRIKAFTYLYFLAGTLLPILLFYFSIKSSIGLMDKKWVIIGTALGSIIAICGFLGFSQLIPYTGKLVFYSWIFLLVFYFIFLIKLILTNKENRSEWIRLLIITSTMIGFCFFRFMGSDQMTGGLSKAIISFGFIPCIILPFTVLSTKKLYAFTAFICYFICLDFFFIHFDSNYNYLVKIGINGCVDYEQATDYPINTDPGLPVSELLKEPTEDEIKTIMREWEMKDFKPKDVQVVSNTVLGNGDSIKVISHLINGQKHYGAIRIPNNIDVQNAPILLELEGGGTGMDVSEISTLTRGKCEEIRTRFISILPSYRGCVLRGKDICYRSGGYYGDAWLGPAEDAVAFLEAVKSMYNKSDSTRVLAHGVSRGATVSLIIGGLTNKLDYIIATSTHTNFADQYVFENERVGNSYSRAFFTPAASKQQIRKKIITSSSLYFAENLPPFELHQGTDDELNTVRHAIALKNELQRLERDSSTYKIYLHEGKGHGYDDDDIVCASMEGFINNH
ncbi:hypothetical protein [Ekhidna sp.]|uniref:hypothetical protein n=1 Tax=Ekhidna sp. TaxID=2608089 RepID=UPI003B508075